MGMTTSALLGITAGVPDLEVAAAGFCNSFDYEQTDIYDLDIDTTALWATTPTRHPRAVLLTPPNGGRFLRLVQSPEGVRRFRPIEEVGPFALEFFAKDVDEVALRLDKAEGFTLSSPPLDYDLQSIGSGICRSLAAHGPGDLWVFVTTIKWVPPPRILPVPKDFVSPPINAPIAATDRNAAVAFWNDLLGVPLRFDGDVLDPDINEIALSPPDWEFRITVFSFGDGQMIEHHFHPVSRLSPLRPVEGIRSGAAGYTIAASDLEALCEKARDRGVEVRGPICIASPPYNGALTAVMIDPHGVLVELVEI